MFQSTLSFSVVWRKADLTPILPWNTYSVSSGDYACYFIPITMNPVFLENILGVQGFWKSMGQINDEYMSFHHREQSDSKPDIRPYSYGLCRNQASSRDASRHAPMLAFQLPAPLVCDACGTFLELTQQNTTSHEITATETHCLVSLEGRILKSRHW